VAKNYSQGPNAAIIVPMPDHPDRPVQRSEPPKRQDDCNIVPGWDVRICMVCGKQMEGRKCKYLCRSCGTMIDCSDAY